MADSETLRALQARLAERLSAVQSDAANEAQWLAVRTSGRNYLIPLVEAGEIFPWQEPVALPYTHAWFWGVVSLRGGIVGVVDVAHFLGHPQQRSEQRLQQARLITTRLDASCAIVVDALQGLRGEKDGLRPTSEEAAAGWHFGEQYVDAEGSMWRELRLSSLVETQEFINVRL